MLSNHPESSTPPAEALKAYESEVVKSETSSDLENLRRQQAVVSLISTEFLKEHPTVDTVLLSSTIEATIEKLELQDLGVEDISRLLPELIVDLQKSLKENSEKLDRDSEEKKETNKSSLAARLRNLKKEGVPLQTALKTLRTEFEGRIDEETNAALSQFEALFAPDLIPNDKEREAVESLFLAQGFTEFTPVVFTGFLTTIYEQPDDVISAETKERIKERFKRPKQRIETVAELKRKTFRKNEHGEYEHNSPENALLMQNGMSSYVDSNNEVVIIYIPKFRAPKPIYTQSIFFNQTNENTAKYLNYGVIHREVFERFDNLSGLFGGRVINDDWPDDKRREAIEKSSKFFRCLVGPRDPHHLIQLEDMQIFGPAMNALANPKNLSKTENLNDFRELGILNGTQFNWDRLKTVGLILRQNRSFQTQAVKDPVAPFRLLKKELQKLDGDKKEPSALDAKPPKQ